MTAPAKRSLVNADWRYDCLQPIPDEIQATARSLLREASSAGVVFLNSSVERLHVRYTARRSPAETRLFRELSRLLPEPWI